MLEECQPRQKEPILEAHHRKVQLLQALVEEEQPHQKPLLQVEEAHLRAVQLQLETQMLAREAADVAVRLVEKHKILSTVFKSPCS